MPGEVTLNPNPFSLSTMPSTTNIPVKFTTLMNQAIFQSFDSQGKNLHEKVMQLPFYERLKSQKISAKELLQHFVNLSAIFKKIEIELKAEHIFHNVFELDITRYDYLEKDIAFFEKEFDLIRPSHSKETQEYLNFIDQQFKENECSLFSFLYVQYSGIFIGRVVCNATISWLKNKIKHWDKLPKDNSGVSYWNFKEVHSQEEGRKLKEKVMGIFNTLGEQHIHDFNRLKSITHQAFLHNYKCIQSVSSEKTEILLCKYPIQFAFLGLLAAAVFKYYSTKYTWPV